MLFLIHHHENRVEHIPVLVAVDAFVDKVQPFIKRICMPDIGEHGTCQMVFRDGFTI